MLAHCRWFSPGTPASTTTWNGRHNIAEIFLKVALKNQKSKKSNQSHCSCLFFEYRAYFDYINDFQLRNNIFIFYHTATPVSSTNKTDRHDIAEIMLKVALNAIIITSYLVNIWFAAQWRYANIFLTYSSSTPYHHPGTWCM